MDVRIGLAESPQVIEIEMDDDADREALRSDIDAAIGGKSKVLWLTDRKGKQLGIPAQQIGFIEVGTGDADRRIGFGA